MHGHMNVKFETDFFHTFQKLIKCGSKRVTKSPTFPLYSLKAKQDIYRPLSHMTGKWIVTVSELSKQNRGSGVEVM